ncbi:hypothetical protein [Acinetobacter baumannii]|uniref:hypothetical protein n=1 Tax=Acinetobacter baumannii TaxID=470 RepID=UPI002941361A|nr:hypothetical protein [Acinetobacter baumannii]MDV4242374.1 hypothetical protein [Acinetobacter baumannii]
MQDRVSVVLIIVRIMKLRTLLKKIYIDIDKVKGGSHERVSKTLLSEKTQRLKGLGYKMLTFHSRRVMADYHLADECHQSDADEAITECEKILKILDECKSKN